MPTPGTANRISEVCGPKTLITVERLIGTIPLKRNLFPKVEAVSNYIALSKFSLWSVRVYWCVLENFKIEIRVMENLNLKPISLLGVLFVPRCEK